jgi:hypothetical protein
MVLRYVQGLEVIVIEFHLGTFGYLEAKTREYVYNLFKDLGYGVGSSEALTSSRKRYIELFSGEALFFLFILEALEELRYLLFGLFLNPVYRFARPASVRWGEVCQVLGEFTLSAEVLRLYAEHVLFPCCPLELG